MHFLSNAMTNKFTHYSIGPRLTILLDCISNITDPLAMHRILNPHIKGFFRGFK